MSNTKLNILPLPTFGQLGVNFTERDIKEYETEEITVGSGEERSIIQYIDSETAAVGTALHLAENSVTKLVQVFAGKDLTVSKLNAELDDGATLQLIQLYLGGNDTVSEIVTELNGRRSAFEAHIGYNLSGNEKLDINLNAIQRGRKSRSDISVRGVLADCARKTFKGTIDFQNGSSGAKGAEQEEVLLMNETVQNKTVPVILCAEEDVEGSHGATIGRTDEKHIFYMKSRGIPEEKIYELMARSKLMQIINMIEDKETKERIYKALDWGEDIE